MTLEALLKEVEQQINNLFNKPLDFTPFYHNVGKILLNSVALQFETEGMYYQKGAPWQSLAPSTIAERKRKGFFPIQILRRRAGDAGLLGSINYQVFAVKNTLSQSQYRAGLTLSTNVFYAPYLHYGTRKMPPRIIFPSDDYLPQEDIDAIVGAAVKFFNKAL